MKKKVIFLLLLFICLPASSGNLYFRHLGLKDGLSQINVLAIYQDEIGAMWFGSSEGLNRYNGTNIEVFRPTQHPNGLTQNVIYGLTGNKKGALYIRTTNDLIRYDIYQNEFERISQGDVSSMCFHQDTLWVTARDSLFYYLESDRTLHHHHVLPTREEPVLAMNVVGNDLWISTMNDVYSISRKAQRDRHLFTLSGVQCFYTDRTGQTWMGTRDNGIYVVRQGIINKHFVAEEGLTGLASNQVRAITEGELGHIWVGTFSGLNRFDPRTGEWRTYTSLDGIPYSLSHSSIYALYNDDQNTIWVGTYFGGINYFYPQTSSCQIYAASSFNNVFLSFPFVGKMTEDKEGKIWICTEGGGLNCFNPVSRTFKWYKSDTGGNGVISHNNLKSIWYREERNVLYIGTYNGGIIIFDPSRGTSRTLVNDPDDPFSLPDNVVNEIQYYKGYLVILTQGGLYRMDLNEEKFYPFTEDEELNRFLQERLKFETFLIDSQDRLWLSHTQGGISRIDLKTNTLSGYMYDPKQPSSIGQFKVISIYEDSRREVYFGTLGSGIYKYLGEEEGFLSYKQENRELLSNYCYYISETSSHHLLVLHNEGFSLLDPRTSTLSYTHNLYRMRFNQGSAIFQNRDGDVFLGGIDGMVSFREDRLKEINRNYNLYFDKLYINNKLVLPGDASGVMNKILPAMSSLKLNYKENNLTFEFCSSNYTLNSNTLYEYKLENFDTEWNPVPGNRIVYTNLSSGQYVLRLRELGGVDEKDHEISLALQIIPPFYLTPYAFILYILLLATLVLLFVRFKINQAELKASLAYERKEKGRIEEMNQIKLSFFTNISHEFRTPLTLIIGQIEYLLQLNKLEPAVYNRILRIYRNTWHLRDLITELLDFRKQEQGFLKLRVKSQNLVSYTREVFMSFYEYALNRHITYRFECLDEDITVWFDPGQMKKVIFNLLSNAFKYTSEHDTIIVSIRRVSQDVQIQVKDSGIGIAPEDLDKVFDRFYQAGDLSSEFTSGTGIGLALSKGIVELHKGTIQVESQYGEGCTFTVTLPLGYTHFTDNEIYESEENNAMILTDDPTHEYLFPIEENATEELLDAENKPTILIVEDNQDLLDMLVDVFKPIYNVHTAMDGARGFSLVQQLQPDIVLGDVMMPNMSGKEMCYKIKNSVELSHIPVVLITAQTSVEYAIEGYMYGADDYITKPFHLKLLVSRCNNLVKGRKILMERFSRKQDQIMTADAITEQDKIFIERTMEVIQRNFDNPSFDMNMLASELNLGRSKLYVRLKEVTGFTPNEFTLKLKLDEAMNLLLHHPEFNITEIAYKLGFSSARYFSKCFKDFYGKSPQEVKRMNHKPDKV